MKLSSENKKIVIFSDVHQDLTKVQKILKHEAADINICLGDWFDSFYYDDDNHYSETTLYLKEEFLPNDKNITLFGNHDLHYLFDNKYTMCSGFENRKHKIINDIINPNKEEFRSKFSWFLYVDNYLCTHAGLHKMFISPFVSNQDDLYEHLVIQSNDANIKVRTNQNHWFYGAGRARGGGQDKGGIVWLDFDREFAPLEIMPQIFGHTYRRKRNIQTHMKTENYCIDTNLCEWMTITNGKMEIKN